MSEKTVHVSVGAGFENDRRSLGAMAAQGLSNTKGPKYLIFECLAERTLALMVDANDPTARVKHACSFIDLCIDTCVAHNIKIVGNFGGPDPISVAYGVQQFLQSRGTNLRAAAVTGDALPIPDNEVDSAIARNAYIGASGIVQALSEGADIVVTGRVADPSLVVGPVVYELGLAWDDWNALAHATLAGHLIECGTQVSGGYFADEGCEVPDVANVGPPLASISCDQIILSKPVGGGTLNRHTVAQQMLYEVHDPASYLTPDVVLDITEVKLEEEINNTVVVTNAAGHQAPPTLKTLLCRRAGWFGEAEISYLGSTATQRAKLATEILTSRLKNTNLELSISCLKGVLEERAFVRLRLAFRTTSLSIANHALNELDSLYVNGPAAGGGVRKSLNPIVETEPGLIPREDIDTKVTFV